jgi:V/A-type H+/Na+-transporting ATPase subunit D
MTTLKLTPTRSNLLDLRRHLGFALEGFELLDQKRQILALELVRRIERLRRVEQDVAEGLRRAHQALGEASLDSGSAALERAALGVMPGHEVSPSEQRLMGISLPTLEVRQGPPAFLGLAGTSPAADLAQRRFSEVLPSLGDLAEAQTAVLRIGRELRRAQRRCNALTKIVVPEHRKAIHYVAGALEEREREAFMDRQRRSGRARR